MGYLRDFTDDAWNELVQMIKNAEGQKDGWLFFNDLGDWVSDPFISGNVEEYGNDIQSYHQKIVDKKNTGADELQTIFDNVYQVEQEYSSKFEGFLEQAESLKQAFTGLAEIFNPSPVDRGAFILARSSDEFFVHLNKSTSVIYNKILNKVVSFDEAGNPVYNWEEVENILSKDSGDITEMEYYILASLYAVMDTKDVERFIQVLADKKGDHGWHVGKLITPEIPSSYTIWEYNQDKIEGLQKYLNTHVASLIYQQQILENMSVDEIRELFRQAYPDVDIEGVNFYDQKSFLIEGVEKQRLDLVQKNSLLTIVGQLGSSSDIDIVAFSSFIEFEGLNGQADASHPEIKLETDKNGDYVLTYCNTQMITGTQTDGKTSRIIDNLNENTVIIGATYKGTSGIDEAIRNLEVYFDNKYNFNWGQSAYEKGTGYITNQVTEKALEQLASNIGDSVANKFGKKAIGFIPVLGDVASLGWELVEEEIESGQNLKEGKALVSTLEDASYCNKFRLDSNLISTGSVEQGQLIFYPSAETGNMIENFNEYLKRTQVDLSSYQVGYPITLEDLYIHSEDLTSIINQMEQYEIGYVFNDSH